MLLIYDGTLGTIVGILTKIWAAKMRNVRAMSESEK
jgi:hypothetical protein